MAQQSPVAGAPRDSPQVDDAVSTNPGDVPLESILCTEELNRRPRRSPDHQTENRALVALAQSLADSPRTTLQTLAGTILEVLHCDSAGISLLSDDGQRFHWPAIAGVWKPHLGGGTPRDFGPCGDVLDRNTPLMYRHFERRYTYFLPVTPPVEECLLVPFYVGGKAVGTIWAITHSERRKFDAEDLRVLESLGRFASAAHQAAERLDDLEHEGRALRTSEREFREMIDSVAVAIYTTDAQGRLTHFNPACVAFSGRTPELGSDHWCVTWKLYYPDGRPMPHDECPMAIALKEGRIIRGAEAIAERPDGTRVWFEPYPTPLRDETGRIVGGINMLVDITERKRAEEARASLAAVVQSSDDAIVTKDLCGVITSWNAGAERLFGYTAQEAVGQPVTMLMPPNRMVEEPSILDHIRRGERIDHYETVRRRKDGTLVDISLTVSPVADANGRVVGASKIARDITERRQAQKMLEQALAERTEQLSKSMHQRATSERMAAVGTLASGLAHDMSNVLLPLEGRLNELLTHMSVDGATHDHLTAVRGLLDHLRAMARNLSLFSRDPDHEGLTGQTDLAKWTAQAWRFIEASMRPAPGSGGPLIRLERDVPQGLPLVPIAPHRLTQAVLNLLHNARNAILSAPVTGDGSSRSGGHVMLRARASPEGHVSLAVIDDGCGMDEETKRRCVEPFFTTHDRSNAHGTGGSGMGLALVHGIVERSGGRLEIESEPGKGTTITMTFPAAPPDRPHRDPPRQPERLET